MMKMASHEKEQHEYLGAWHEQHERNHDLLVEVSNVLALTTGRIETLGAENSRLRRQITKADAKAEKLLEQIAELKDKLKPKGGDK